MFRRQQLELSLTNLNKMPKTIYSVAQEKIFLGGEYQDIVRKEQYTCYREQKETSCATMARVHPVGELSKHDIGPVFADSRNRVYFDDGKFYRYQGALLDMAPENWKSCQVVTPSRPGDVEVYLRQEEKCIQEGDLLSALGLDYLLALQGKVLLHAAYIQCLGQAVLFTAPSGTGKSTQAELWRQHRPGTRIVNGDRAVFSVEDERTMAHGFPFCGSSGISHNISCPLKAIVVLRQGKKNHLVRLVGAQAATILLSECMVPLWDRIATQRVMDTVTQVVEQRPIYLYHCLPDASAVEHLYHVIYEGGKPDE